MQILQPSLDSLRNINDSLQNIIDNQLFFGLSVEAQIAIIAAFSSITAIFLNIIINKLSYKNEYYKKILEKRLEAADQTDSLLSMFQYYYHNPNTKIRYYSCFTGYDNYCELYDELNKCAKNVWISFSIRIKMETLLVYINENIDLIISDHNSIDLGRKHHEQITTIVRSIREAQLTEMLNLHKVKKFIRRHKNMYLEFVKWKEAQVK